MLTPVLAPGERLLAAAPVMSDPGTTEDVSLVDELKSLLDPTFLIGGRHPGALLQRATFGRAVNGGRESQARQLHDAVDRVTTPNLVVTDRHLVVADLRLVEEGQRSWLRRWFGPVKQVASVVHRVPREAIVGAIMAPAGALRRGRFLVAFADGSVCAVSCSLPELGRRTVDAIGAPRAVPGTRGEEQA